MSSKNSRKCICCNAEIKPIEGAHDGKPWQNMWLDGIVDKIAANYGSENDGNVYVIAICDSCVKSKVADGTLQYVNNYMFPEEND